MLFADLIACVFGVCGVNWLDMLLGRLLGGVGVRSEILSFESTRSGSIGTRLVAAKLFRIVCC